MSDEPKKSGEKEGAKPSEFATWAEYAEAHPEAAALHEADKAAVASALEKERTAAKEASAKLRDLAKTADAETAKRLNELALEKDAEIKARDAQLAFYAEAVKARCHAVDKAWTIAQATQQSVADLKSDPIWGPALFEDARRPNANAGAGTGTAPPGRTDMDTIIRAKAHK